MLGAAQAVLVAHIQLARELLAQHHHLFGRAYRAAGAGAFGARLHTHVVEQPDFVIHHPRQQATGRGTGNIAVALATGGGAVQDQPGQLVFFRHGFVGHQLHRGRQYRAGNFHPGPHLRHAALGADIQRRVVQRAGKTHHATVDVQVLAVGLEPALVHADLPARLQLAARLGQQADVAPQPGIQAITGKAHVVRQCHGEIHPQRQGFTALVYRAPHHVHIGRQLGAAQLGQVEAAMVDGKVAAHHGTALLDADLAATRHQQAPPRAVQHGKAFQRQRHRGQRDVAIQ